jgi:hypothetical protein
MAAQGNKSTPYCGEIVGWMESAQAKNLPLKQSLFGSTIAAGFIFTSFQRVE